MFAKAAKSKSAAYENGRVPQRTFDLRIIALAAFAVLAFTLGHVGPRSGSDASMKDDMADYPSGP